MKKLIICLVLLVFIALVLAITPFIMGYTFKNIYYQQIAIYQQAFLNAYGDDQDLQLQIESYNLGWYQSTAQLKVTANSKNPNIPPLSITIQSHIKHGPLVTYQNKLRVGYAVITSFVSLPEILKPFASNQNFIIQVDTLASLNAKTWESHYMIPALTYEGMGKWDGFLGDVIIHTQNDMIVKVENDAVIGKIEAITPGSIIELAIAPITIHHLMTRQADNAYNADGALEINLPHVTLKERGAVFFDLDQLNFKSNVSLKNEVFNYDSELKVKSINLPAVAYIQKIDSFLLSGSVNDLHLSKDFINQSKETMVQPLSGPMDFSLLMPSSKSSLKINFNSDVGAVAAHVNLSLLSLPKNEMELSRNIVIDFNLRMPQVLFNKMIEVIAYDALSRMKPRNQLEAPQPIPPATINSIVAVLVKNGIIVQDKNDYVLILKVSGPKINLNNKESTENEFVMLFNNTYRQIMQILMPPPPIPSTTPMNQIPGQTQPMGTQPVPTGQTQPMGTQLQPTESNPKSSGIKSEYHCYWMNSSSGKNIWELTPYDNDTCYRLDSCSGGLKQSGGGCYKWATSVDYPGIPWNT